MEQELINNGKITEKEFKKQLDKHKKDTRKSKDNDLKRRIFELVKQGKTASEIAIELNYSVNYISRKTQQIFREKKLSEAQIRILQYGKILKLLKDGITPQEIAYYLNMGLSTVYDRQEEFIKDGTLTKEQLKECRKKRRQEFEETKIKALKEYEEDSNACASRKKFFKLAEAEVSYGNSLEKEDVQILGKSIINNDTFLTKENLRLVVTQYIVKCEPQEINKFFNSLIILYEDTEFGDEIKDYRKYAVEKIKERKGQLDNNSEGR